MRITALELENIKSYGARTAIDLTPGLNAVCGSNGSGKTTVLEAIGWALFDHLPYKREAFLREGAKNGTVRVRLLARDAREYEVVRRIGSGSAYYVADLETGMRLAERTENVLDWIRTFVLDLEGETDLKSLFVNAVGVPQGTMTSVFQQPTTARKSIFDPLLRVEEYRQAYETLLKTVNYLRDRSATVSEEIAALLAFTDQISPLKEQIGESEERLRQCERHLAALAVERTEVERQKDAFDEVERLLNTLQRDLDEKMYDIRRHGEMSMLHEQAARTAEEAVRIVRESEAGYRLVQEARARLDELQRRRAERDTIREHFHRATAEMHGIYGQIQQLDGQRNEVIQAADEATSLDKNVARQIELENALEQGKLQLGTRAQLDGQIRNCRRDISDGEKVLVELDAKLQRVAEAQTLAARLDEVSAAQRLTGEQLAALAEIRELSKTVTAEGKQLKQQYDALSIDVQHLVATHLQIAEKEPLAAQVEVLETQQQKLREERIRTTTGLDYLQMARAELDNRHCPLLDIQCPAIAGDPALLVRVEVPTTERIAELDAAIQSLEPRTQLAKAAARDLQDLRVQVASLQRAESDLPEIENRLRQCREQYRQLAERLATEESLIERGAALQTELNQLQEASALAGQLPLIQERRERELSQLELKRQEFCDLEAQHSDLVKIEERVRSLERELELLSNPRARRERSLALAARLPQLEASIERQQVRLAEVGDRVKALNAQEQQYETLDQEVEAQRVIEREHSPAYERYLQHRGEAGQLEVRRITAAETRRLHEAAQAALGEVEKQLHETRTQYDAEQHALLKGQHIILHDEIIQESTNIKHLRSTLKKQEDELSVLLRKDEQLRDRRRDLDELEQVAHTVAFIRDTIKAAGPVITETLLANISQTANDIFAEIMDDHAAELRWDKEYDVLVQHGAEERKFTQLSGGEQMSAALALRLALLKEMSEIDFAFFDEPTQNMDSERRSNLASQIRQVRGFDQLIVISHDDTFEHHTDNLIRLKKVHEETQLESF